MKHLICWKLPLLNFSLQYISLKYDDYYYLHKFCIHILNHSSTTAIIFYLPQLIQSLRTQTHFQVPHFILKKCKESSMITHQFLWALKVEEIMAPKIKKRYLPKNYIEKINSSEISKILRYKIIKNLNYIQRKFWYEEDKIFSDINEVSACFLHPEGNYAHLNLKMTKEEKTTFVREELSKLQGKILPYIYLPTNPTYRLSNILPKSAVTLQSAKKVPFIVSFEATEYSGPDNEKSINNMTLIDFVEFEFKSNKNNNPPLIVSLIHTFRNNINDKNNNKYNNIISDEEELDKNSINNQNSVSLSDIDINDEGNIYNDTAQEKDNPQNLYIPILEPRAFRENNIEDFRNNTIDKDFFPNDSTDNIPKMKYNLKNSLSGINNEKLKENFLGAYERNNAHNLLTLNRNNSRSEINNKISISPTNINSKYNEIISQIKNKRHENNSYQSKDRQRTFISEDSSNVDYTQGF